MMHTAHANIDPAQIIHFEQHAQDWWDRQGPLKALHDINPLRLQYIETRSGIVDQSILDVGCGGGLLSEALAINGGRVMGIDMSTAALQAAQVHGEMTGVDISYHQMTAEVLAAKSPASFDIITCMELLEHVPQPESILNACHLLLKPGGHVFLATVNRTWTAYVLVILAAEHLLKIVRRGTHAYRKFIRPAELRQWALAAGLKVRNLSGVLYNPFSGQARLTSLTKMNYLMHLQKP
jgi:2-polyprenyl-6-hydroxyphenyl methylase/3-demethylubiquinone-9 3-methyltransferase